MATARALPTNPVDRAHPSTRRETSLASPTNRRSAGIVALVAVTLSVVGAVLNQAIVEVDLWAAMDTASATERARLLSEVADAQTPLVAGIAVWMIAFPLTAMASVLLARLGRQSPLTDIIRHTAAGSIGAILVFLSLFIAFVVVIAPAHVAGEDVSTLAHAIGFAATTIDWAITAIVLGIAPIGAVYAGRGIWAPRWLQGIAALVALATVIELVGLAANRRGLAFPVVPLGLLLLACAGICALRSADNQAVRLDQSAATR